MTKFAELEILLKNNAIEDKKVVTAADCTLRHRPKYGSAPGDTLMHAAATR